jgi:hypothetical protein
LKLIFQNNISFTKKNAIHHNEICIPGNKFYNKSAKIYDWTTSGKCIDNCPYGPALINNITAHINVNTQIAPTCNYKCNKESEFKKHLNSIKHIKKTNKH